MSVLLAFGVLPFSTSYMFFKLSLPPLEEFIEGSDNKDSIFIYIFMPKQLYERSFICLLCRIMTNFDDRSKFRTTYVLKINDA